MKYLENNSSGAGTYVPPLTRYEDAYTLDGDIYYADAKSSGTNLGTYDNPFTSLASVDAQAYNPGDAILFKAGTEMMGGISPNNSGSDGSPILFGAYGDVAFPKPIINYFTKEKTYAFSFVADDIWIAANDYYKVNRLWEDGVELKRAFNSDTAYDIGEHQRFYSDDDNLWLHSIEDPSSRVFSVGGKYGKALDISNKSYQCNST